MCLVTIPQYKVHIRLSKLICVFIIILFLFLTFLYYGQAGIFESLACQTVKIFLNIKALK
jgi:hypothetical protein